MDVAPSGTDVLQANRALREWATGLRAWSRHVRESSAAERDRTRRSGTHLAATSACAETTAARADVTLPSLGTVSTVELEAVLRTSHGLSRAESSRALLKGMLLTGYPLEADRVASADAFEVIDHALGPRS